MDAVLNWLWQGGLVALAAAALLGAIPRCPARSRYCVVWAACIVVLALPCVPFLLSAASPTPIPARQEPITSGFVVSMPVEWWTSDAFVFGLWAVWVVVCTCQLAVAARALRRMRNECRQVPRRLETHLHHWSLVKTTGRRAGLMLSTRIRSAAVLGAGAPIIALAPSLVEHLSDDDVDRVVIHEWAHVQRRDDIAQYFQFAVRVIAGWHPAIWWLQRQLSLEREVACDEAVVAATGSAKAYAACLATVAAVPARRVRSLPALAMSSSGLGRRVIRILALRPGGSAAPAHGLVATAAVIFVTLAMAAGSVRMVTTAGALTSVRALQEIAETPVAKPAVLLSAPLIVESPATRPMLALRPAATQERVLPAAANDDSVSMGPFELAETAPAIATSAGPPASPEPPGLVDTVAAPPPQPPDDAEAPVDTPAIPTAAATFADNLQRNGAQARGPWTAAADAGATIGRRSQNAGVATAASFTRFGRKIAASF